MRTREKNKEYIRNYRFRKKFDRYKNEGEGICHYCGEKAETLHHINENHADNRPSNLLPLCNKCHLEIMHLCDKPNYYSKEMKDLPYTLQKRLKKAENKPKEAVILSKSTSSLLKGCNTGRIYNVTLLNPITSKRIHITEGKNHLLELFNGLGYTEKINNYA